MAQLLLIPDPKPLVERLGPEFFRQAPESPGVYLMRDAAATVLYVGKAKNLRRRLGSYRVANPQRFKRRHLRLLRAVASIEFERCPDEPSALARESELLRELRPRFNRAGVWPGPPRFLAWRITPDGLELTVSDAAEPGWNWHGPTGVGAVPMRAALVRLLWHALRADRGLAQMPGGWFHGRLPVPAAIPVHGAVSNFSDAAKHLCRLFSGDADPFIQWIRECGGQSPHRFDLAVLEEDLEAIVRFFSRISLQPKHFPVH